MTKDTDKQPAPTTAAAPAILTAIVEITAALSRAGISKNRENQQQRYSFRGIEDVYAALSPLLAANRVAVLPRVVQRVETVREAKSGGAIYSVAVEVHYTLMSAVDGSHVSVSTWGEAMDSADKATNKAMSAAFKYMAFTTFVIPVEGQDDADATTPPETQPARRAPAAKNGSAKVEPFDSVEHAVAALDGAMNHEALEAIAARVKASGFKGTDYETVREAYGRAVNELKEAK